MGRLFGTDGVRARANTELTVEMATALAQGAAVEIAGAPRADGERPRAVLGRDPRRSGASLSAAVAAGLASMGVDVRDVGVIPTPGLAYLTDALGADLGVMISASHNPMADNGIKFFARGGRKLADGIEDRIEARLVSLNEIARPAGAGVGTVETDDSVVGRYLEHLANAAPADLSGLKVVVDCANGAASEFAPLAYAKAGAEVIAINASPDGVNINDHAGSTHPEALRAAVVEHGADLGIAHDGDADRALAVDATGAMVDGDAIMAILALALEAEGKLHEHTLVATVMSNLGLHLALREAGIAVETTGVGDRYVLEALERGRFSLGGEQSGHIVFADAATTGDGLLTALRLMGRVAETGSTLAELASVVTVLPQLLVNVPVTDKDAVADDPAIAVAVAEAEAELGDTGRVLLRPSGTEQLIRVMVEAADTDTASRIANSLAAVVAGR